jgi:hypothetical protein
MPLQVARELRPCARREEYEVRTVETTATITPDGSLTVQVPPDIMPGTHQIVLVIDD